MSVFLTIIWGVGVTVIVLGLFIGLLVMNYRTRGNVAETMIETFVIALGSVVLLAHANDTTHEIFTKVYKFLRMCVGLTDEKSMYLGRFIDSSLSSQQNFLGILGAMIVFTLIIFIRYMIKADSKLLALLFFPIMIVGHMIIIIGLTDRIISTPVLLIIVCVVIVFGTLTVVGVGKSPAHNGNVSGKAAALEEYEEKLKDRERLENYMLDKAPFTAEERMIYGEITGDEDQISEGIMQKLGHDSQMREYEKKLNKKDDSF